MDDLGVQLSVTEQNKPHRNPLSSWFAIKSKSYKKHNITYQRAELYQNVIIQFPQYNS